MKIILPIIMIFILSMSINTTNAASAGDDDTSPPVGGDGGGGGGGGAPEFFDYYVPLVFNASNPKGESEVTVWFFQQSVLITDFSLNAAGTNVDQVTVPTKLTFKPSLNPGLTNGSLIRTTTPVLMVGQRTTEDIFQDRSFGYSILPSRMMGFEYIAPFDGFINLVSLTAQTIIGIKYPGQTSFTETITIPQSSVTIPVVAGTKINSSFPTNGAFISDDGGTYANMAVPRFLHGNEYLFDTEFANSKTEELDQSFLRIIPELPTEVEFRFTDGSVNTASIFGITDFKIQNNLESITALQGDIAVNLFISKVYAGLERISSIQLFAAPEMRSGELFLVPQEYSSHLTTINDNTVYQSIEFDESIQSYNLASKLNITSNRYDDTSFSGITDIHLIWGNHSSFGYLTSPGKIGHPMSPSISFVNIPLNSQTQRNITGVESTWYRFPNLAVLSITVEPGPPEEYTGQTIKVVIGSNGSLPASRFQVQIIIDEKTEVDETYDFLQVNDTLEFEFERFIDYGVKKINVTASVDVQNEVNEINEEDNILTFGTVIDKNIRLRWSIIGIAIISTVFILRKIIMRIKAAQRRNRAHVDAIINFEEIPE